MRKDYHSKPMHIEENFTLSISEVCLSLGIEKKWVIEVIEEGIVHPTASQHTQPTFDQQAITRLKTSLSLHRDLGVNLSGIALVLDLLDEIETLKRHP